jgi:hypothetical protein
MVVVAVLVLAVCCGVASEADAQQGQSDQRDQRVSAQHAGGRTKRARGNAAVRRAKAKAEAVQEKPAPAAPTRKPQAQAAGEAKPNAAPAAAADDPDVHAEGDTQVKVMEFSGLDIEGQLKTPQMLYFLNRLRAEFGRPKLPHRSFMPELQHGAQESSQR